MSTDYDDLFQAMKGCIVASEELLEKLIAWCIELDEPLATQTGLAFGIEANNLIEALERLDKLVMT